MFIDTPAAYPGIDSEERGVAEAIAANLRDMSAARYLRSCVVCVSGEGGSGGALGIAIGDRILMQEYAIYSVIPPEGCAAILWRDPAKKVEAAEALKLTAPDLLKAGIIDEIVREPVGGAHTDPAAAAVLVDEAIERRACRCCRRSSPKRGSHSDTSKFRSPWARLGADFTEAKRISGDCCTQMGPRCL